ncbi:MAG TPA: VWA domain-containing protein, partial [Vicinamibacterales bacterium]|nr:VWA domain-containing protein [Vicinamibacterales bacterium]
MASSFRTMTGAALVLLTVVAASGDVSAGGQQSQPPAPQTQPPAPPAPDQPVFKAGINFVRVDVIITDKSGNPVGDLQPGDFEVVEDGKPQKIETFKLVKLDGGTAEAIKEPPKQIRTDYDEEAEAARDDVRLFAIFLDDYHVRRGASMSVRKPIESFVETQLGPTDMVGLMYPLESLSSIRMTRNHAAIMKGIDQFVGRKYDYTPRNEYEEQYAHYPAETVEQIRNQVSMTAIRGLITHMGSLKEGRKALILVSEGFTGLLPPQLRSADSTVPGLGNPQSGNPMAGLNDPNEDRASWSAGLDLQSDLRQIYDTANRNNVAIYAVDPRGLPGFEFDINEGVNIQTDQQYLNSTMDTLRLLSEQTDGRAIVNRNDLATGMKQIVRDTSAYYLLGYNSTQTKSDGKFHEIKVRVKRPGVQVRARKGYWALNAEETARALAPPKPGPPKAVSDALASVNQPSRARVVRTWIGTTRGENGKTKVTFVWEPSPKTPGQSGRATEAPARVSLMAAGTDGVPYYRGRVPDVAMAAASPPASGTGGSVGAASEGSSRGSASQAVRGPSRVTFEVPPGKMELRVAVEGDASEVLDSEVREITVPDLTSPQISLGTPAVFRARTARDFQQLKADVDAVPQTARDFS